MIVLNEWILNDLRGDNGRGAQEESFEFLQALRISPERIAVLRGTPWLIKAYRLMKHSDPFVQSLGKFINQAFLLDLEKCLSLSEFDIVPLPEGLREVDLKNDRYLFEIYYTARADVIVTTDERLIEKVRMIEGLQLALRNDFLRTFPT